MKLLQNPEVKRQFILYGCFSLAAVCGTAFLISVGGFNAAGVGAVCTAIVCIAAGGLFFGFTSQRYRQIARLNQCLNQILHGDYSLNLVQNQEGELAVLSSEIHKMTIMLREQAQLLERDNTYLSNSLADISHQLRTPLTTMRIVLLQLRRECSKQNGEIRHIHRMDELLSRIEWLVSALLKLSQLESGTVTFRKEPVLVSQLLKASLEPLTIPAELKELTIRMAVAADISYIGDYSWTLEAIGNILKNAIEHTPAGGQIIIESEENPVYTGITISDTGNGFRPEDLPHLFERFYKGADSGKNNIGIGLSLARMIITGQNGTVQAFNRMEQGAQFQIRFYKGGL